MRALQQPPLSLSSLRNASTQSELQFGIDTTESEQQTESTDHSDPAKSEGDSPLEVKEEGFLSLITTQSETPQEAEAESKRTEMIIKMRQYYDSIDEFTLSEVFENK
jgi:hypothetical protein